MDRKSVIVLGFARAGTSMTCGVIECLGFKMLTQDPKPQQLRHNPKGMYEMKHLLAIGNEINKRTKDVQDPNYPKIAHELKDWMKTRFHEQIPETGNWGFKSPTIYGVDVLLHYMHNPHILCINRNIVDQAKSFQMFRLKNDNIKTPLPDLILEMSKNYMHVANEARRLSYKYPVDYTTYEGLKSDPWKETQRIAEFLGVVPTEEMKQKVLDFVEPTLHTWKDDGLNTLPIEIDINKYKTN